MTAWQMHRCDWCQQLCFDPIRVDIGIAKMQMCFSCFEDAVTRSNGRIVSTIDGQSDVIVPLPPGRHD